MELLPLQAGDAPDTKSEAFALIAADNYRPVVSVEEGVEKFVAWIRGNFT